MDENATTSDDLQACEHCRKEFPIEDMTTAGDCWICPGCYTEWKQTFDACKHEWEPHENEFGEPGKYCGRCMGFMVDEEKPDNTRTAGFVSVQVIGKGE
jgi:hypothetical protein